MPGLAGKNVAEIESRRQNLSVAFVAQKNRILSLPTRKKKVLHGFPRRYTGGGIFYFYVVHARR